MVKQQNREVTAQKKEETEKIPGDERNFFFIKRQTMREEKKKNHFSLFFSFSWENLRSDRPKLLFLSPSTVELRYVLFFFTWTDPTGLSESQFYVKTCCIEMSDMEIMPSQQRNLNKLPREL